MKEIRSKRKPFCILACMVVLLLGVHSATAAVGGGWQNHVSIYGWLAAIDGTAKYPVDTEADVGIEASDILEDLKGIFMGNYSGRYDRWSVLVDAVYLNIGDTGNTDTRLGTASVGLDITSWVVTGAAGYDFVYSDQATLGVIGGVRYLSLDTELDVGFDGSPLGSTSETSTLTDGIIGLNGRYNFNEHWFLPFYADIGTGGSDYSYQLFAAIGYRYKWFDVTLGYRHLYFKLGDDELMEDLQVSGPKIGIGFSF